MSRSSPWILLALAALVAGACGNTATLTPAPSSGASAVAPSQASASSQADDTEAPPSGTLPPDSFVIDTGADPRIAGSTQENAERASGRASAGVDALLGPDGATVETAIDQQLSDQLWAMVDEAGAAASSGPRTTATVILASVHEPHAIAPPLSAVVPPPGMSYLGPWITSLMLVDKSLGKGAFSESKTDTKAVELGQNTGNVTTDSKITVTPSGSHLTVDVTTTTKGEVSDENGRLIFRIDGNGRAHIEVDACPDPTGLVPAAMEFSADELYFTSGGGGRSGSSWHQDDKATAQIVADDEAKLDHISFDMTTDHAVKGGTKAPGSGQSDLQSSTIGTTTTGSTFTGDGSFTMGDGTFKGTGTTMAEIGHEMHGSNEVVGLAVFVTGQAAERFWRDGKCVEVVANPNGGDVGADSTTKVTATVRHVFEGKDLDKPVEATMTGVKSIEPSGTRVPSPADFTFTAGSQPGDAGIVTFKSVSNRGIGETTVTWTVADKQLEVSIAGTSTTSAFGVAYRTTVKVTNLRLARQADGSYLGSAPTTTTIKLLGDIPCSSALQETGTVMLRATREATGDAGNPQRWLVSLAPGSVFKTSGKCYGIPIQQVVQSGPNGLTGDFIDLLGTLTFDPAGGTLKIKKSVPVGASTTAFDVTVKGVVVSPSK